MFANFTEETCTGTGATLALAGATTGRIAFNKSFADGDLVAYVLEDSGGIIIVAGVGTYVSATDDITRADTWTWNGTVIDETPASNITLNGGTHTVRCGPVDNQLIGLVPSNPEILGGDSDGILSVSPSTSNSLGGNIVLYGDTHSTKAKDLEFRANTGIELHYDASAGKWDFQANAIDISGIFATSNTTDSTSPTTGSIQTDGGLAVGKSGFFGGDISIVRSTNAKLILNTTTANSSDSGEIEFHENSVKSAFMKYDGNANELVIGTLEKNTALVINRVSGGVTFSGDVNIGDTTDSTSTATGSIQTDGGLGVVKNIIGGQLIKSGSGTTGSRPTPQGAGSMWFDTTLGKPIWHDGTNWIDATGTTI